MELNFNTPVFAAGTVDCVYPRPVEVTDTYEELFAYFNEKGKDEFVSINVCNAFDEDGNYTHAVFGSYTERDGASAYNDMSWDNLYAFRVEKRYSAMNYLVDLHATNLRDLIFKMEAAGVRGTLNVRFYNNIRGWNEHKEREFRLVIGA